jgi:type IV pilus assembly protein PilX
MSYINQTSGPRHQRGAALVVGLLLLTVITLLAIAGMNSASVELVMAGNSQYHGKAFQAAETGIESTIVTGGFLPAGADEPQTDVAVAGSAPDKFTSTLHSDLGGAPQPAIWGNSATAFSTYHFQITSVGSSARNAQTTHVQGIAVLSPFSPVYTGPGQFN